MKDLKSKTPKKLINLNKLNNLGNIIKSKIKNMKIQRKGSLSDLNAGKNIMDLGFFRNKLVRRNS